MTLAGFKNPGSLYDTDLGFRSGKLRYPHPFFDVAQTYLPVTIKHLFRWCHIYYVQNGLVNAIVNKMARYPVTNIHFKAVNLNQESLFEQIFKEQINLESFCIELNVDRYVYGNAFCSIHYPIVKYLTCKFCGHKTPADSAKYKFKNFEFFLDPCQKCKSMGSAIVKDVLIKSKSRLRLIRHDPMNIDVIYNEATGESNYILSVPQTTAQRIREGNPLFLNHTPQIYIEAVKKGHRILLDPYNIYHLRRQNVAGKDMGIGSPLILPVLKDLYLMQVLKKAQEAISHEHIVPLRIIHPMGSGSVDPVTSLDLSSWQGTIRAELARWKQDPNYTPVVPLPIGFQYMGGHGRSLLLANEIKQLAEHIATGMEVPIEFAFGGMSYSGSSISLRMLENQFLSDQIDLTKCINFVVKGVARFLGVKPIKAEFTSIRTADDIQRKSLLMQLAQTNKISDATLLAEFNLDPEDEQGKIEEEMKVRFRLESKQFLENAQNHGRAQIIQQRFAARAQQEINKELGYPTAQQVTAPAEERVVEQDQSQATQLSAEQLMRLVKKLKNMDPIERAQILQQLKQYLDPKTLDDINKQLSGADEETMRPLPKQRPPRRSPENAVV